MLRNLTKPLTNFAKVKEYIVSKLHIGRMPAEASEKIVEDELIDNLKTMGRHAFRETLVEENKILNLLLKKKQAYTQQIDKQVLFPLLALSKTHQPVSTWNIHQKKLREIVDKETLMTLNENIDWLTVRQRLFKRGVLTSPSVTAISECLSSGPA